MTWLTPQELANVSMTCKSLNKLSHSITLLRSSDASRTFENFPIPFLNTIDNHPYSNFLYTPYLLLSQPSHLSRQPWGGSSVISATMSHLRNAESASLVDESGRAVSGCECREPCRDGCPCLGLDGLDDVGRQCGPGCFCGPECGNRSSRKGVAVRVKILTDGRKGWGLFADQFIPKGLFLFEYAVYNEIIVEDREVSGLLKWKASFDNHSQSQALLSSWTGADPCKWEGIACDKSKSVSSINLANYGLQGTLHTLNFSSFPNLLSLNIHNNSFYGTIPPQISNMSKVKDLNFSKNSFYGSIPKEMWTLSSLHSLDISSSHN